MSANRKITTSVRDGLRELGSPGQRSWELITATLGQSLGPRHAALFAEPVRSADGVQIDWYSGAAGQPRNLASLDEPTRAAVEADMAEMFAAIGSLADELDARGDGASQRLAEALRNAIRIPGPEAVHVLGTGSAETPPQPVLTDWATVPEENAAAGPAVLTGWAPRPAPPSPASMTSAAAPAAEPAATAAAVAASPVAAGPDWRRWILAALALLLLGLSIGLLFVFWRGCVLPGWGAGRCAAPGFDTAALTQRVGHLEEELAAREADCAVEDDFAARLGRESAGSGAAEIALIWNSTADLDLHVACPAGDRINFDNRVSAMCGGRLDIDMNAAGPRVPDPVEHVYFDEVAPGTYDISVRLYDPTNQPPQSFRLRVNSGDRTEEFSGQVSPDSPVWSIQHDIAP